MGPKSPRDAGFIGDWPSSLGISLGELFLGNKAWTVAGFIEGIQPFLWVLGRTFTSFVASLVPALPVM